MQNKRKKGILIIIVLIIFIICYCKTKSFLLEENNFDRLKDSLDFIEFGDFIDKIVDYISFIFAAMVAGIVAMIGNAINLKKLMIDIKKDKEEREPHIEILVDSVTTLRKRSKHDIPEIVIGDAKSFVYVYTTIKNSGRCTIRRILINDQVLNISLMPEEEHDFHIRVCKHENNSFKDDYKLILKYRDDKEQYYSKQYKLKVDERELEAEIFPYKHQKKCKG